MSNKNFFLILLILLLPFVGLTQVTKFMGRYDVTEVSQIDDSTWSLVGDFVDLTGSYTGLDASVGDKIIQRGYNQAGRIVFDRYTVISIDKQTANELDVTIRSDFLLGVQNSSSLPSTGSFPIASPVSSVSKLTYRTSFYQNQIDQDYDAALDNLNLQEISNTSSISWEHEVVNDSENNWTVLSTLVSSTVIIYNGLPLRPEQWSGLGTTTLNVSLDVRKYDYFVIIN